MIKKFNLTKITFLIFVLQAYMGIAQTQNFLDRPYLETAATFTTDVIPDKIYLDIAISEKDTRGKTSIEVLENQMISKLSAIGIDVKAQLTVSDLSSDFQRYFLRKTDVIKIKHFVLLIYDAQMAGHVAKELEQINISNIGINKTEYSKLEELKIELRGKAIAKAKRQAESMLKPLNQQLGKALYISDSDTRASQLIRGRASGSNTSNYAPLLSKISMPDIGIKEMKVQVAVTVYFEIL